MGANCDVVVTFYDFCGSLCHAKLYRNACVHPWRGVHSILTAYPVDIDHCGQDDVDILTKYCTL